MSELIPLLCKRCPGICQDSQRQNTGTSEKFLSAAGFRLKARKECLLLDPQPGECAALCITLRSHLLVPQPELTNIDSQSTAVLFVVLQELNLAKQSSFSSFLLSLPFLVFLSLHPLRWPWEPPVALIHTKLSRAAELTTHPACSRNQHVLMGTYSWLLGEGSELDHPAPSAEL